MFLTAAALTRLTLLGWEDAVQEEESHDNLASDESDGDQADDDSSLNSFDATDMADYFRAHPQRLHFGDPDPASSLLKQRQRGDPIPVDDLLRPFLWSSPEEKGLEALIQVSDKSSRTQVTLLTFCKSPTTLQKLSKVDAGVISVSRSFAKEAYFDRRIPPNPRGAPRDTKQSSAAPLNDAWSALVHLAASSVLSVDMEEIIKAPAFYLVEGSDEWMYDS